MATEEVIHFPFGAQPHVHLTVATSRPPTLLLDSPLNLVFFWNTTNQASVRGEDVVAVRQLCIRSMQDRSLSK